MRAYRYKKCEHDEGIARMGEKKNLSETPHRAATKTTTTTKSI